MDTQPQDDTDTNNQSDIENINDTNNIINQINNQPENIQTENEPSRNTQNHWNNKTKQKGKSTNTFQKILTTLQDVNLIIKITTTQKYVLITPHPNLQPRITHHYNKTYTKPKTPNKHKNNHKTKPSSKKP